MCEVNFFGHQWTIEHSDWMADIEEAVSAGAEARRLRYPHHLHFGEASPHPCSLCRLQGTTAPSLRWWDIARRSSSSMASVTRAPRALAQAASCTTSTRGPCAGPQTMPRSPWLAKVEVYTQFTPCLCSTRKRFALSLHHVCISLY